MFRFIYNVVQVIFYCFWSLVLTVITGKMPKISPYHFDRQIRGDGMFDICSDKYIEDNTFSNASEDLKRRIIDDYILFLGKQDNFTNIVNPISFPIFDGRGIVGKRGYYPVMKEALTKYLKQ